MIEAATYSRDDMEVNARGPATGTVTLAGAAKTTVPVTPRLLSNTSERENMNCELKRTSAKEVRGVLF